MAKAKKFNWSTIKEQFYADHQRTGITRNEWARLHGLNLNTARKRIPMPDSQKSETLKSAKRIKKVDQELSDPSCDQLSDPLYVPSTDRTGDRETWSCEPQKSKIGFKQKENTMKKVFVSGENRSLVGEESRSPIFDKISPISDHKRKQATNKRRVGAQPGNQNARKHGRYSDFIPANWLIAADETEVEADLMMIRAHLIEAVAYRAELSRVLAEHIASYEDFKDKDSYKDIYEQYKRDMFNTDDAIMKWKRLQDDHLRGMEERKRVRIDTKLKATSVRLTEAKTEHAKIATALNKYELTTKEKTGLGEKDDLGMILDEIADMDDDEINQRFKARETQQKHE